MTQLWRMLYCDTGRLTRKQNGTPDEFTVSGSQWFRQNNFTALPILLVNPVALYGYGDINIVPAVCHNLLCTEYAGMMHILTRDAAVHLAILHSGYPDRIHRLARSVLHGLPQDVFGMVCDTALQHSHQDLR